MSEQGRQAGRQAVVNAPCFTITSESAAISVKELGVQRTYLIRFWKHLRRKCESMNEMDLIVIKVIPNLWACHHNPSFWPDPWTFKPERFLDEEVQFLPADHPNRKQWVSSIHSFCCKYCLDTIRILIYSDRTVLKIFSECWHLVLEQKCVLVNNLRCIVSYSSLPTVCNILSSNHHMALTPCPVTQETSNWEQFLKFQVIKWGLCQDAKKMWERHSLKIERIACNVKAINWYLFPTRKRN